MNDLVKALMEKVSQYNIFNYLLPGAVFAVALEHLSQYSIFCSSSIANLIVVYFAGMVLSRVGSAIIEPLFRGIRFLKYCDHSEFVAAEKKDPKIAILLQENNAYRTLTATFLILILVKIISSIQKALCNFNFHLDWIWPVALLLLFAFSYRKQTSYIVKRVASVKE